MKISNTPLLVSVSHSLIPTPIRLDNIPHSHTPSPKWRRGRHTLMVLIGLLIMMTGCDKEKFYDQSASIPNDMWSAADKVSFNVNIEDTISPYRFYINIRNSASYRYSNIYFFLTTEFPGGGMSTDTIECTLADKSGKWLGKGTGKYRDNRIFIRENIKFPRMGGYTFSFKQAMREEVLNGISEVGIRLEKQQ